MLIKYLAMSLIVGFTSPNGMLRPASLTLLFACTWKVISICPQFLDRVLWQQIVCGIIINSLLDCVEAALISRWSFEAKGPTSSALPEGLVLKPNNRGENAIAITSRTRRDTFWERFRFGFFVVTSTRNIGTPYVVKNTPPFSMEKPEHIPSRLSFLVRKAFIVGLAVLILDLVGQNPKPLDHNAVFFSADAVPILANYSKNLSGEQIFSRFVTVLVFWIVCWSVIEVVLSLLDFLWVAFGITDVRLFRPNFGSIVEAYSIRQFWR